MTTPRRSAYTLVELVLGMATSTILLGALTSAMIIATKAMPEAKSPLTASVDGAATVDLLASDLFTANTITTHTSRSIEFQVADRNNDGCPETIYYEWSGVAGEPLQRKYNDALALIALSDINEFQLDYDMTLSTSSLVPAATESEETLLASNVGAKNRTDWSATNTSWTGQFFRPALPANSTSWKVTRVELLLRTSGTNDGIARVELCNTDAGGRPTGVPIADANVLERELPTGYLWRAVNFTSTPAINASAGAALIIKWIDKTPVLNVQYQATMTAHGDDAFLSTSNAGATWTTATNKGLLFKVYGTATAANKPTVARRYTVNSMSIKLRAGTNEAARVETIVPLPNEPEVTGT